MHAIHTTAAHAPSQLNIHIMPYALHIAALHPSTSDLETRSYDIAVTTNSTQQVITLKANEIKEFRCIHVDPIVSAISNDRSPVPNMATDTPAMRSRAIDTEYNHLRVIRLSFVRSTYISAIHILSAQLFRIIFQRDSQPLIQRQPRT